MRNLKWKTLSSQYLFKDLWFTVRKDRCETPQGKIIDPYYVYEFPAWVCALAITRDGKVVMVRQYRQGLGETGIELPGGCVDPADASWQQAIARELAEETGFVFSNYQYLGRISANTSTNNNLLHMFLATGGEKTMEQHLDPNEEIEVELYTIEALKELLRSNQIIQAMHVSCILYGLEKLGALNY